MRLDVRIARIDVAAYRMALVFAPITATTPEAFKRVTEVTYLGSSTTLSALKRMPARNRGTLVQIGSALTYHRSIPQQAAYCAASSVKSHRASNGAISIISGRDLLLHVGSG